jgi:hypothetical protein
MSANAVRHDTNLPAIYSNAAVHFDHDAQLAHRALVPHPRAI